MDQALNDCLVEPLEDGDWLFTDVTETFDQVDNLSGKAEECCSQPVMLEDDRNVGRMSLSASANRLPVIEMPPQLHPAVSLGVRRVSSCYFSLGSQESMTDLLSQIGDASQHNDAIDTKECTDGAASSSASPRDWMEKSAEDVLYHDILTNVFKFLDAPSLKSFSETARRPNFEVFYYLQLQLQQALLIDDANNAHCTDEAKDQVFTVAGSASLSRLAALDMDRAHQVVEEYLQSNSTLRTMPLSHSLAYARRYLLHHGFSKMFPNGNNEVRGNKALASAALFMTVVGAASLVSTVSGGDATTLLNGLDSFGSELPNVLFRVGFMGSLMGAARQMSDTEQRAAMRETAEHMTRSMKELPGSLLRGDKHEEGNKSDHSNPTNQYGLPSLFEMRETLQSRLVDLAARGYEREALLSNPYDHLPDLVDEKKDGEEEIPASANRVTEVNCKKMPSGCVGAYARAIQRSSQQVLQLIKDTRKASFLSESIENQRRISQAFMNACSSNGALNTVKNMAKNMDVDAFFMGNDGSETCALHTAAFQGADQVVEYLCSGIDESNALGDGGLCDVNNTDANGWTALHFACGANSISVIRILVEYGADPQSVANNGYTALQWAIRLSNEEAAKELSDLIAKAETDGGGWISSQPLTCLANRFFSLMPTH